jgi:hypothetical protein
VKFKKTDLQDLACDEEVEGFKIRVNKIVGKSRWANEYRLVFEHGGKFYETSYRSAATEQQDERPFDYEPDEIECIEVEAVERKVIDYKPIAKVNAVVDGGA